MIRIPCSKCGSVYHNKVRRVRFRNGKIQHHKSSSCVLCYREGQRVRYESLRLNKVSYAKKLVSNNKWADKNSVKIAKYKKVWEIRNFEKRRLQKQEYYIKNKDYIKKMNRMWREKNKKPLRDRTNKSHVWRFYNKGIFIGRCRE